MEITQEQFDYIVKVAFEESFDSYYTDCIMIELARGLGLKYESEFFS